MVKKCLSQIDFAIAVFVIITTVAFSVSYVTNYFSHPVSQAKSAELRATLDSLKKILFESAGLPKNWEDYNYTPVRIGLKSSITRIPIMLNETGGVNRTNETIEIRMAFDLDCANKTYNNTIRIFDKFLNPVPFKISNITECVSNTGFLKEANIAFKANQTANQSTIYWVFFSNNTNITNITYPNTIYETSLVGYWKLDSANATNHTFDETQYKNDGKLINYPCDPATCNFTSGQVGNALNFDGVNDYVMIGDKASLEGMSSLTVEAWIKTGDSRDYRAIVSKWWTDPNSYILRTDFTGSTGKVNFGTYTTANVYSFSTTTISDGQWHHIVGTYDGSNQRLYIDGVLEDTDAQSGSIANSEEEVCIGDACNLGVGQGYGVNGTIDEVRIYNRSLSEEEVKALYYYTKPKYVSESAVPVVSYFKINALQNLDYDNMKASLGLQKHFNVTVCGYSFGRQLPETASIAAAQHPVLFVNSTGEVKACMASINVW